MERGGLGYIIIAIEVDPDHIVPVDLAHLVKDAIAQNAGIVHHRVELAEGAQGIFDDAGGSGGVRNICGVDRSEEHTSELQSLMRISYAVFCLKKKKKNNQITDVLERNGV